MRIVIIVSDSHPELLNELSAMPVRYRADRIRTLAVLGLIASKGTANLTARLSTASPILEGEAVVRAPHPHLNKVRDQLRQSLMG